MSWPGGAVAEHKHVLTNYYPTASSRIVVWVTHCPDGLFCSNDFLNLETYSSRSSEAHFTDCQPISMQCKERLHVPHSIPAFQHRQQCVQCTFLLTCLCECVGVGWERKKLNTQQMAILWLSLQWNADQQTTWNIFCSETQMITLPQTPWRMHVKGHNARIQGFQTWRILCN